MLKCPICGSKIPETYILSENYVICEKCKAIRRINEDQIISFERRIIHELPDKNRSEINEIELIRKLIDLGIVQFSEFKDSIQSSHKNKPDDIIQIISSILRKNNDTVLRAKIESLREQGFITDAEAQVILNWLK